MAILAQQTIVGNVGRVYDLRTVGKNNTPVLDFSVAVTPRKKDGDEWVDGETYWITITAWNKLAENVAESFKSGDRVFVYGRIEMKSGYTNKEGNAVEGRPIMIADFAGLEVSYNAAESKRESHSGQGRSSKPSPKKETSPKPAAKDDDLFGEDDFDFNDNDSMPF